MIHVTFSTLTFTGQEWLWPAIAALAVALVLIAWGYARSGASHRFRAACASLKVLAVVALVLCLLEPTWSGQRIKPGANIFAVIADDSASLQLQGRSETQPRVDVLRGLIQGERAQWRNKLAEQFDVRNYLAGARLQTTTDFSELKFEERASALGQSLTTLRDRFRGQPFAGVLLLTDGIATDLSDAVAASADLPPVYPVLFGQDAPARDLAVTNLTATQTPFEDAPVTIQAEVLANGFAGRDLNASLYLSEDTAKPVSEQTVKVTQDGEKLTLRFLIRPDRTGVLFYRVRVTPKDGDATEATLANNEATVTVDRSNDKQRVLYVSGRPNWEYKFLQRAIQGDTQTELAALIRIAKREPKFEFRGRAGESSNPLFRGFGNQSPEEIARYDQPVLLRLNTEDEHELSGGFPKTAEELFRYRAVIIDDLEAEFFTADQMALLQRFVSERGGSLLMLGGAESFADGNYARTALGEMLPVYLDRKAEALPSDKQLKWALSRDGWLQPWARLRTNEAEERKRLDTLPTFDVLNGVGIKKPAASVVATVSDGTKEYPALVTQRFGRGLTAALLVGDLWHAGLGEESESLRLDLEKTWRQLIRALVADVPAAVQVRAEPQPNSPEVRIQVDARDRKFQALDNAGVTLTVTHGNGAGANSTPISIAAEPAPNTAGIYEATFVPREDGGYRVEAVVTDETGIEAGKAQSGWSTNRAASEFRSLAPDRALMEELATKTGGRVLTPDELAGFVDQIPSHLAPVTETWSRPLWHTPVMFIFALGCLVAEWGVRRWKGLP